MQSDPPSNVVMAGPRRKSKRQVFAYQLRDFPYYSKLLLYSHDTMVKHNKHEAAARFAQTHNLDLTQELEVDVPQGYFYEWLNAINIRQRARECDRILRSSVVNNAEATPSTSDYPVTLQQVHLQDNTDGNNNSTPPQQDSDSAANRNGNAMTENEVDDNNTDGSNHSGSADVVEHGSE